MSKGVIGMSRDDCLIVRQEQEAARRRFLAHIDYELVRGPHADLYRAGMVEAAAIKQEQRAHRLDVEILEATEWPHVRRYRVACSCGWMAAERRLRLHAEQDLAREREHLDRPLMSAYTHTEVSA